MAAPRNTQQGNPRYGLAYRVQKAPGGAWHIYPDGRKVFVRAGTPHPQAPASVPTAPPAPAQLAPDAQYFTDRARSQFDVGQEQARINEDQRVDRSNYDEALRRMADNEKQTVKNNTESFNQRGLFYSGQLGQAQGDAAKEYARQRADALQGLNSRENARANARRALEAGATIDEAAALAASGDRQIDRDTDAAESNSLAVNPAPAAPNVARPATKPPTVRKPKPYRTVTARGSVFHVYKNGRRVAVRRTR